MRVVLQRCQRAQVRVLPEDFSSPYVSGGIKDGFLVLVGFGAHDGPSSSCVPNFKNIIDKILNLRVFSDEQGKMNRSLLDINGSLLVVSQFTLYADIRHGRRPSFTDAAPPDIAKALYEQFCLELEQELGKNRVQKGVFGANMHIDFINDGPVTITLDSEDFFSKK